MAAESRISDSTLWGNVAVGFLVLVGLLVLARLMALTVTGSRKWAPLERRQAWLMRNGRLLIVLVTAAWTIRLVLGGEKEIIRWTALVMVAVAGLVVFVNILIWRKDDWAGGAGIPSIPLALVVAGATAGLALTPFGGYLATAALTAAGVAALGLALGIQLRMRLTVRKADGGEDPAGAAYVVARISTMGADRPRGLKAPEGTDVLALPEEAVNALPKEGQLAAGVLKLMIGLFSLAPWRANIVFVDDTTVTVDLRRNAQQVTSTLIFHSELGVAGLDAEAGPPGGDVTCHDLLTAAAAFLLLELSKRHPALKEGLCGTERWRSLAGQVLAGTAPWQGRPEAEEQLFATAVEQDPGNHAAWLGYLHSRAGTAVGTPETEKRYVTRLSALYERLRTKFHENGYQALCMRSAYTLASAHIDYGTLLSESGQNGKPEFAAAARVCRNLCGWIAKAKENPDEGLRIFAKIMDTNTQILASAANGKPSYHLDAGKAYTPSNYYLQARVDAQNDPDAALEQLDLALGLPEYRIQARTDPSLRPLWKDARYGAKFDALLERPMLTDIEAFRPYQRNLREAGIHYPEELVERDGKGLADSLKISAATVAWMRGICRLACCCPHPENAISWTDLLTREGVDTPDALTLIDGERKQRLIERLQRLAWTVAAPPITDEDLKDWIARIAEYRRSHRHP
ncbi:hypothetical protein [Actinomadura formosensis]|uniref:hypothetical protein n=1 Tax=Actinomadura formosensis TaxID=60706 RepID=UPI003D90A5EE